MYVGGAGDHDAVPMLLFATAGCELVGAAMSDGAVKWRFSRNPCSVADAEPIAAPAVTAGGVAVVGMWDNYLWAVRVADGHFQWGYNVGRSVVL